MSAPAISCTGCGGQEFDVVRPGWTDGLRQWLTGSGWRRPQSICRRCGTSAGSSLVHRRFGPLSVPVRLLRALRLARWMIPSPAIYLAAAATGLVLGAVAQLLLDWSWWLVAAGVVIAVWVFFMSTAFWGGPPSNRSLATDLLRAVRPQRAFERDLHRTIERFRSAPGPLYGLPPSWSGERYLGRWATGRGTAEFGLAHRDPAAGTELEVTVSNTPSRSEPSQPHATIIIDGQPVTIDLLMQGRDWFAVAALGDRRLTLQGRNLPVESIELVEITDIEPYVDGHRRRYRGVEAD